MEGWGETNNEDRARQKEITEFQLGCQAGVYIPGQLPCHLVSWKPHRTLLKGEAMLSVIGREQPRVIALHYLLNKRR